METYLVYPKDGIRKKSDVKQLLESDNFNKDDNLMLLRSESLRGKIAEITHGISKTIVSSGGGKKRKNRKAMFSNKKRTKRLRSKLKLRKYTKHNKSVNKKRISKKHNKSLKKKPRYTKRRY